MRALRRALTAFATDASGASTTEYALIAAGIAVAIIASLNAIGSAISHTFGSASASVN